MLVKNGPESSLGRLTNVLQILCIVLIVIIVIVLQISPAIRIHLVGTNDIYPPCKMINKKHLRGFERRYSP